MSYDEYGELTTVFSQTHSQQSLPYLIMFYSPSYVSIIESFVVTRNKNIISMQLVGVV